MNRIKDYKSLAIDVVGWLCKYAHENKIDSFVVGTEYEEIKDVDLFISNYALSECDLPTQMAYYDKIITNSKFVYMIYNLVNFNENYYNDFIEKIKADYTFDVGRDYENTVILATKK